MAWPAWLHRAALLLTLLATVPLRAQQVPTDPASTHIFPAGGQRGTTVQARIGGECLPPYTRVTWHGDGVSGPSELVEPIVPMYEPAPRRKPGETPINYPREWVAPLQIAADAPLGCVIWRLSCARGGSGGRPFVIGDLPEYIEVESNSTPATAEPVTLPLTINGQIAGERDLDYFRFTATAGQTVSATTVAARLGSPLEPIVEFLDGDGHLLPTRQVRQGGDPLVALTIPADGEYTVGVSNLGYQGGSQYVYRITLSNEPAWFATFPAGEQAGTTSKVTMYGVGGTAELVQRAHDVVLPALPSGADQTCSLLLPSVSVLACPWPSIPEVEPATPDAAIQTVSLGHVVDGQISGADDQDLYEVQLPLGTTLRVECQAWPPGGDFVPQLAILDQAGQFVQATSGLEQTLGPLRLEWAPPPPALVRVRVSGLPGTASGTRPGIYRLLVEQAQPDFRLEVMQDAWDVTQGGRSELEVRLERRGGFAGEVEIIADALPPGVRWEVNRIPAGHVVARLALVADATAPSASYTVRLSGQADVGGQVRVHPVIARHLGRDLEGVSLGLPHLEHLQLTVRHQPLFRLYCNEAYQYAYRGTVYPYLMEVERLHGYNGPIHLQMADRQNRDLDGIEIVPVTIPAGESQLRLPIYLPQDMHINVQAHSNVYAQGFIRFTDPHGQEQSLLVLSEMRCMIRPLPGVAQLETTASRVRLPRGGRVAVPVRLDRTPLFAGPAQVRLNSTTDTPGIVAEPATLAAEETTAVVWLSAAEDAPLGTRRIRLRAEGALDGGVTLVSEVALQVSVDAAE